MGGGGASKRIELMNLWKAFDNVEHYTEVSVCESCPLYTERYPPSEGAVRSLRCGATPFEQEKICFESDEILRCDHSS